VGSNPTAPANYKGEIKMTLEEVFMIYNIPLIENEKARKLSDILEDMYLRLSGENFEVLKSLIAKEEPENNIFEKFRENFEE
jgi:hypothetical protein